MHATWTAPTLELTSSQLLLTLFVAAAALLGALYKVGVIGAALRAFSNAANAATDAGFAVWRRSLAWLPWPVFLALVLGTLTLSLIDGPLPAGRELIGGVLLLFAGVVACLAFVHVDLERYEVGRGYKVLHNPSKGQTLAQDLLRYGHRASIGMLVTATIASATGFAVLNHGLYQTVGANWYQIRAEKQRRSPAAPLALLAVDPLAPLPAAFPWPTAAHPDLWNPDVMHRPEFIDFFTYTLLHLLRVTDVLDVTNAFNLGRVTYVHQDKWPAATLLFLFKSFFTLVLLQQIFTSFRQSKLLAETIRDFWSPQEAIHERARLAVNQFGRAAVAPLLRSAAETPLLTEAQRARVAETLAEIGPVTAKPLLKALKHPSENVRAVAVLGLGRLRSLNAVFRMVPLAQDASEQVRQCLVEALGSVCQPGPQTVRKQWVLVQNLELFRSWFGWVLRLVRTLVRLEKGDLVDQAVTTLRALLRDPSATIRSRAAQTLGGLGQAAAVAVGDLLHLLRDADDSVRCRAAEAVGKIGVAGAGAVAALTGLLRERDPAVRVAAAQALANFRPQADAIVPALVPLLQDPDEAVRKAATEAIGRLGTVTPDAAPQLVAGLASRDNLVRAQTAEVIGEIGTPAAEAVPALLMALTDRNDRVRANAAQSLGKIKARTETTVPALMKALDDEDHLVCSNAAAALGELGPDAAAARPALLKALRHVSPLVRAEAAGTLGKLGGGDEATVAGLQAAAADPDPRVRAQAVQALGALGAAAPLAALLKATADADDGVRAAAVAGLRRRGEKAAAVTQALLTGLRAGNDAVKTEAAAALGLLADPTAEVLAGLTALLDDDTPEVQIKAAEALGHFGPAATPAGAALAAKLQTAAPEVREALLRALGQIQPPEALEAFQAGLQDPVAEIRKLASAGVLRAPTVPEEMLPVVVEALRDPEGQVRANAALTLLRLGQLPDEAVPLLVEGTAHALDVVRWSAARALQALRPEALEREIDRLLSDPNLRVRLLAARYRLNAEGDDKAAAEAVRQALTSPTLGHRRAAVELLGSLASPAPALVPALRQQAAAEPEPELRRSMEELADRFAAVAPACELVAAP